MSSRLGWQRTAVALTAILGKPTGVDVSGQVDLQFSRTSSIDYTDYWPFGNNDTAAFEIKSLPGGFRHAESRMGIGEGHTVMVRFASEILSDAAVQLIAACDALARKCGSTTSKNAFLIIHPFDAVAAELFEEPGVILGHLLPLLSPKIQIDTLWILWHPDSLDADLATLARDNDGTFVTAEARGRADTMGRPSQESKLML